MGDEEETEKPAPQGPKPRPQEPEQPTPGDEATSEQPAPDETSLIAPASPAPTAPEGDASSPAPASEDDDVAAAGTPASGDDAAGASDASVAADAPGGVETADASGGAASTPAAEDAAGEGDATTQLPPSPAGAAPDHTRVMTPAAGAWAGRAEVRPQRTGLRDSAPYPAAEPPRRGRTWWTPLLLGMVALGLVGVVILAAWFLGRDSTPDPAAPDSPAPIVPTSATPVAPTTRAAASPTPSAAPELVEVPRLLGDTQAVAVAKLDAAGLSYRFDYRPDNAPRDTVIATDPSAGARVQRLTTIVLVISLGPGDTTPTTRPTPSASAVPN